MVRYSLESKEAILKKVAPTHNMTVAELLSQEALALQLCTMPEYEVTFFYQIQPNLISGAMKR